MYGVPYSHLSLEEYAEFLQVPEPFLYGIRNHPDYSLGMGCGDYWQQSQRVYLGHALAKTDERLEADRWLGFPLRRKYMPPRELEWGWPLYLGKYVRGLGVEAETTIESGAAINLRNGVINDPVTLTVTVDFTDVNELLIYYPGQTKYTIRPSEISISGGVATITIPRCRLLKPEYFKDYDDNTERPDYEDDSYFLSTVDVVRNYLNTTTGCNLVWHRRLTDTLSCCYSNVIVCDPSNPCGETLQLACGYVVSQRDGFVQLEPATYNGGWSKSSYAIDRNPDMVQVSYMQAYYDRYDEMGSSITRALIALAHNNMPQDPCFKCAIQQKYYEDDIKPLEPAVDLGLGRSTWGVFEAKKIIEEFDNKYESHHGGML